MIGVVWGLVDGFGEGVIATVGGGVFATVGVQIAVQTVGE
jgi:hypothetical protein